MGKVIPRLQSQEEKLIQVQINTKNNFDKLLEANEILVNEFNKNISEVRKEWLFVLTNILCSLMEGLQIVRISKSTRRRSLQEFRLRLLSYKTNQISKEYSKLNSKFFFP